jgi:hypothetical protein
VPCPTTNAEINLINRDSDRGDPSCLRSEKPSFFVSRLFGQLALRTECLRL